VPAPALPRGAVWEDVAPSPDGRRVAGSRSVDGRWALVRWPADSPDAAVVLLETSGSIADVGWTSGGELWFVADPTGFRKCTLARLGGGAARSRSRGEPLGARARLRSLTAPCCTPRSGRAAGSLRRAPALEGVGGHVCGAAAVRLCAAFAGLRDRLHDGPSLRPHFWIPCRERRPTEGSARSNGGNRRPGRFAYAADLFISRTRSARGDFVLVSSVLGNPTLDLSAVGVVVDLDRHRVHRISRCRSSTTMRPLGASFVTRRLAQVGSVRAPWSRAHALRHDADTCSPPSARGVNTQNLVRRLGDAPLSRLWMGALSISPDESGHVVRDLPAATSRAPARWSERGKLPGWRCTCAYRCRRLRAP